MANYVVTTLDDETDANGTLSLREAVALANANNEEDTITFLSGLEGGTLRLTQGPIRISDHNINKITIDGDANDDGVGVLITGDAMGNDLLVGDFDFIDGNPNETYMGRMLFGGYAANLADNSRIFVVSSDNALTIDGLTLTGGVADNSLSPFKGGAIFAGQGSSVEILDSRVAGNYAGSAGGGVYGQYADIYVYGTDFYANYADGYGGAIYNRGENISQINMSGDDVGTNALVGSAGSLTVYDSSVGRNYSSDLGGAIYASYMPVTIDNTIFTYNSAYRGGAIHAYGADLYVDDSDFLVNFAYDGGAISFSGVSYIPNTIFGDSGTDQIMVIPLLRNILDISDSEFSSNSAVYEGGAISAYNSDTVIYDTKFDRNGTYDGSGGAASFEDSGVLISKSSFYQNYTDRDGGGIFGERSTIGISHSKFDGNSALDYGGGIATEGSALTITNSAIVNNAAGSGGGVNFDGAGRSKRPPMREASDDAGTDNGVPIPIFDIYTLRIESTTFEGNYAQYGGGLRFLPSSDLKGASVVAPMPMVPEDSFNEIVNTTFVNNAAGYGGGIYLFNSFGPGDDVETLAPPMKGGPGDEFLRITNSTLTGNTAFNEGGGIANLDLVTVRATDGPSTDFVPDDYNSNLILQNSIVQGNEAINSMSEFSNDIFGPRDFGATNIVSGELIADDMVIGPVSSEDIFRHTQVLNSVVAGVPTDNGASPVGTDSHNIVPQTVALNPVPGNPAIDAGLINAPIFLTEFIPPPVDFDRNGLIGGEFFEISELPYDGRSLPFPRIVDIPQVENIDGGIDLGAAELGALNNPPVAMDDTVLIELEPGGVPPVNDDGSLREITINVLANDSDPDGDPLTVVAPTPGSFATLFDTQTGVPIAEIIIDPDGDARTVPIPGNAPPPGEFARGMISYTIFDGIDGSADAEVFVDVFNPPGPVGPVDEEVVINAQNDSIAVQSGDGITTIPILSNDEIVVGTMAFISQPPETGMATVVIDSTTGDASVAFDPGTAFTRLGAGEMETVVFAYTIMAPGGQQDTALVSVKVTGVNDPPVALDRTVFVEAGESSFFPVQIVDPDQNDVPFVSMVQGPPALSVALNEGVLNFDATSGFEDLGPGETETLFGSFLATDGEFSDTGMLTIHVMSDMPTTTVPLLGGALMIDDFSDAQRVIGPAANSTIALPFAISEIEVEPVAGGFLVTPETGEPVELRSIEEVQLTDTTLFLDRSDEARTLYEFFEVFLGRGGDPLGLGHYKAQLDNGRTLDSMADELALSLEAAESLGGAEDNRAFVEALYQRGLGRDCDEAGCEHWTRQLDNGTLDRGDVGEAFAASDELADRLDLILDDGLLIT